MLKTEKGEAFLRREEEDRQAALWHNKLLRMLPNFQNALKIEYFSISQQENTEKGKKGDDKKNK